MGDLIKLMVFCHTLNQNKELNVWFEYAGHVELLTVRVQEEETQNYIYSKFIYLDADKESLIETEGVNEILNDLIGIQYALEQKLDALTVEEYLE